MGDTSGCQISSNNLAVYIQGVSVEPSSNITSQYFVTASLPSSASLRRVWQFTTQGKITGPDTATLTLDYTQAHENCPDYNITFEGALNGTFIVKNQVFSANKFISYQLTSTYVLVLTLRVPKSIQECFGPGTTQNYSFSVFLNDAADANCTTYTSEGYTFLPLLNETGGSVTLTNNSAESVPINYLCVGGGGGGGGAQNISAGGGGGGYVSIGTFTLDSSGSVLCNYLVGAGGSGGSGGSSGNTGGSSGNPTTLLVIDGTSVLVDVSGSGGKGGEGAGSGGNGGDSGFSDSSGSVLYSGGTGCSSSTVFIGGGGAGASKDGSPSNSNCNSVGNGGNGYQWIDGNYYGGGGGGTGTQIYSGTGGQGGGASGNTGNSGTSSTGGGGGGGISDGVKPGGGNGGSGICVLAWSTAADISFSNCS